MQPQRKVLRNPQQSSASQNVDYKELQKTLIQFQKAQLQLEKTKNGSPLRSLSPLRAKEMINFQALQEAGLIGINKKLSTIQKDINANQEQKKVEGVKITLDEIERAFKILDEKNNGHKVSLLELKKKIPQINPIFPINEIPALTQGRNELKSKDLYELLKQNELENFDPLEEAFALLDPQKTGSMDIGRLRQVKKQVLQQFSQVFHTLGYGDIDKRDVEILYECLDLDKDGKISVNDLREIFEQEKQGKS